MDNIDVKSKIIGIFAIVTICIVTISCDGVGDAIINDDCLTRQQIMNSNCLGADVFVDPGPCEPLVCESDVMNFTVPSDEIVDCFNPNSCDLVSCNGANLIFDQLAINEDGNLEGNIIVGVDAFSAAFVCF